MTTMFKASAPQLLIPLFPIAIYFPTAPHHGTHLATIPTAPIYTLITLNIMTHNSPSTRNYIRNACDAGNVLHLIHSHGPKFHILIADRNKSDHQRRVDRVMRELQTGMPGAVFEEECRFGVGSQKEAGVYLEWMVYKGKQGLAMVLRQDLAAGKNMGAGVLALIDGPEPFQFDKYFIIEEQPVFEGWSNALF